MLLYMKLALFTLCTVDVVHKICELVPLEDVTVKVLRLSHASQLEFDEYCLQVPIGTTVATIADKLLGG